MKIDEIHAYETFFYEKFSRNSRSYVSMYKLNNFKNEKALWNYANTQGMLNNHIIFPNDPHINERFIKFKMDFFIDNGKEHCFDWNYYIKNNSLPDNIKTERDAIIHWNILGLSAGYAYRDKNCTCKDNHDERDLYEKYKQHHLEHDTKNNMIRNKERLEEFKKTEELERSLQQAERDLEKTKKAELTKQLLQEKEDAAKKRQNKLEEIKELEKKMINEKNNKRAEILDKVEHDKVKHKESREFKQTNFNESINSITGPVIEMKKQFMDEKIKAINKLESEALIKRKELSNQINTIVDELDNNNKVINDRMNQLNDDAEYTATIIKSMNKIKIKDII